ncbi:hypothetical protein [Vibrio cholerae]|uniref:hypothetical protein n=1 Tax=Vibrio cholerae TaxID=666 RepID=UPI000DE4A0CE|nr:hypothetical protein [Vibrio cholerae]EGR1136727.1 hypothetical protein [Vibrio cholerae]RBM42789.1 hypothetical protein DLR62_03535 [Vibrio tarriae]TXZ00606.1 hypothetical protein FXE61_07250 [Vibrio cholerae]
MRIAVPKNYRSKVSKAVAYKKLQGVLERLNDWNELYSSYYEIEEAALVGSLARGGEKFGDIDVCLKIRRSQQFSYSDCKNDYIKWREQVLGYKPPAPYSSAERCMFETDVSRFIKSSDGRIEMLRWDQFEPICLTLQPFIKLVENGRVIVANVEELETHRITFTAEQALDIVKSGVPENPRGTEGIYWESYCAALKLYPAFIRDAILDRDAYCAAYRSFTEKNET